MLVELADYDSVWPKKFTEEKLFLKQIIGSWCVGGIEHVGSTSVPGLIAKPIIDIMFGVESLEQSTSAIKILQHHGYCYTPYKADVMHWFCKPSDEFRTHHLHLIPYQSNLWNERITFRDVLRSNPKLAMEYSGLKKELALKYRQDREAYTQAKWPFVKKALTITGG